MAKKKTYCEWCGVETKNKETLISKISLVEHIEDIIDKFGREDVLEDYYQGNLINAPAEERAKIYAYLDLVGDMKKRIICELCLDKYDKINNKYYSEFDMDDESFIEFIIDNLGDDSSEIES